MTKRLLLAFKSWPGEPVRHSEAAKKGWQHRRVLSAAATWALERALSEAQRTGAIDWQYVNDVAGDTAEKQVRSALARAGLINGRGRSARLNILGTLALRQWPDVVRWVATGQPQNTFTAGLSLIALALREDWHGASLDEIAERWRLPKDRCERYLLRLAAGRGSPFVYSTSAGLNQAYLTRVIDDPESALATVAEFANRPYD